MDQIAKTSAGSVKEVPDQFIVLETRHHVEDLTATRTDVGRSEVAQVSPEGTWYALLIFQQAE